MEENWIDEQEKFKNQAQDVVKQQAYFMKRALDSENLAEALKHANTMLCELKTSLLTPKNYYELYIQVCDELRHMEMFFTQEAKRRPIHEIYQLVQHAANVLPRLYLLITAGSVYIKTREVPAKDILRDLVEMCKGVQHPMRGLFLRNYLSQMTKDKLPDVGNDYESDGDGAKETIDFIIQNFTEMNKLWVRMQHQGPARERDKREKERLELRILVGTNLVRLSQLEGVDVEMYQELVLTRILEQVLNCKDQISQQYLMEVIIQVFPDDFHLQTLEPFLQTCTELQAGLDVKGIFISMADRLAKYAQNHAEGIPEQLKVFNTFVSFIAKLVQNRLSMDVAEVLSLQVALLNFAIKCYPDRLDYVDHVLGFCAQLVSKVGSRKLEANGLKFIVQLLLLPVEASKNVLVVLDLDNYGQLMGFLEHQTREKVALSILKNIISNKTKITEVEKVDKLYNFVSALLKGPENEGDDKLDEEDEDFTEKQRFIARLVHLFANESTDTLYEMYVLARKIYGQGGPKRIQFTLPSLIFCVLRLAVRIHEESKETTVTLKHVFKFVHETLGKLNSLYPQLTFKLYLQAAQTASRCDWESAIYEFLTQALSTYEDHLCVDSKVQFASLQLISGSLNSIKNLSEENRDTLMTKVAQYSAKLMKRQDQARAVSKVSHLFWGASEESHKEENRCLECLQRSLNCAKEAVSNDPNNVLLYVEILNEYLYFFGKKNSAVTSKYVSGLIALIRSQLEQHEVDESVHIFFKNTCAHIVYATEHMDENSVNYSEIVV
eukprot:c18665_g2_i1.p1 GENE.c18665_g2_i1~~c18665_g2_i1.p1  ORF type:complete len:778 (-),score=337.51 c18665_g2_i1:147-2480(-)